MMSASKTDSSIPYSYLAKIATSISLLENLSSRFLEQKEKGTEEMLDKHRFQVQSKAITDSEYSRISGLPVASRADEVSD
jgi:hypothetical protein